MVRIVDYDNDADSECVHTRGENDDHNYNGSNDEADNFLDADDDK